MEEDISFIGMFALRSLANRSTHVGAGLGQMGYGMATNLRKKLSSKATMYINDINADACDRFVKESGDHGPIVIVPSAKEAASKSSILVSIVPASKHVRQVYLNEEHGVIAATRDDNRLVLECSTIDVDTTRQVGQAVMDAGRGRYVDAPVSVRPTPCDTSTV